ncbi:ankyrin repeat domain-containing protein [Fulvivirga lutea]|uniref:Ankyrin repeat domain-containing protein n=1 Tax=Fulvivirga lutea TaxID=2810512 RepID=A0A974WIK3_9BACT|nr:ankyrin repeat domain-containing protein [Fulvivirga lutea]QSE99224.1 ankyrin repeat domain-containing protein [Fulvivirga lutea]
MTITEALRNKDLVALKNIITNNPQVVNHPDGRGFTPLILATYFDDVDAAKILLESGANINAQDASGNTALMGVCFKGSEKIVNLLLDHGADTSLKNHQGDTALAFAEKYDQPAIAKLLKERVNS